MPQPMDGPREQLRGEVSGLASELMRIMDRLADAGEHAVRIGETSALIHLQRARDDVQSALDRLAAWFERAD